MKISFVLCVALVLSLITISHAQQPSLTIVPVQAHSIAAHRLFVGGTVAAHKSVILSAQIPGRIITIAGEEGDRFKAGGLLVQINADELLARRQTALAQYSSAAIAVNNADVQYHRQIVSPSTSNHAPGGMGLPGMFDQVITNPLSEMIGTRDYGVERGSDIFAARARLDQAHHALAQARAQIQQIDTKLRDSYSIAPFDGVIVSKKIEIGDTVQPGQTLLVYEDQSILQIILDVPQSLLSNIKEGQSLNAQLDSRQADSAQNIPVIVAKIFPSSDPLRHTTRVKLNLPDNSRASPGNYAQVWIPAAKDNQKQQLLIPASAVINRGGIPSVFVINNNNQAELHLVRVGDTLNNGLVVILYGIKKRDRVLDKPPSFMTSGYQLK